MVALRRLGPIGLLGLLIVAALAPAAGPVLAADPGLAAPTATVRFLDRITFSGRVTPTTGVRRAEIIIDVQGSERSFVGEVATVPGPTSTTLTYDFATPGGAILPNTSIEARFRLTLDDGSMILGPPSTVRYEDTRYAWNVRSGELVTVRWTEGGAEFGQRALQVGDAAIRKVSTLLGVTETDPIDFYIYADRAAFYDVIGAGARENVGGQAHPEIRTLFANIAPDVIDDPWVGVVIPHELTHLVFDTAVANPYHYPPRWLNEGLAVYLSKSYDPADRGAVQDAVRGRTLMPLRALTGQFPTTAEQFTLAYSESVSAVDLLVRKYGSPALVTLVRSYAGGMTDDEAFRAALGTDVAGFEAAWLESIGAPEPSPYGPLDAPPGPVPSDWLGQRPVPGEIPSQSASPGPRARPETPESSGDGDGDGTGLLAALVVLGLSVAGVGVVLGRRNRSARLAPAETAPEVPGPSAPDEPPRARDLDGDGPRP
ncbi:MAG: hypothetical protein C0498_06520 [Anaerolinea sp.]|nr:hypothetical protein [Anaerolinea sp.]